MNANAVKRFFVILCLVFASFCGTASGADFAEGYKAYQAGDYATALLEWGSLAEQGDANAQLSLATMYVDGKGVAQDYEAAEKWYRQSAEQGNVLAQYGLAKMKSDLKNYEDAEKWYRQAAEQEYIPAMVSLGVVYGLGEGVPQDYVYSHMWFNLAASLGDESIVKVRDTIAKSLSPPQLVYAQRLARECIRKNYKGC